MEEYFNEKSLGWVQGMVVSQRYDMGSLFLKVLCLMTGMR
jgi:hypothetical protein